MADRSKYEQDLITRLLDGYVWQLDDDMPVVRKGPTGWRSGGNTPHIQMSPIEDEPGMVSVTVLNLTKYASGTESVKLHAPELVEMRDRLLRIRTELRARDVLAMLD